MLTLQELMKKRATEQAQKIFLRFGTETTTFAQLREQVASAAGVLTKKGIRSGDRVALLMTNHPQHITIYLALAWIGAISIEVSTHLKRSGIALQLNDAEPRFFIVDCDFFDETRAALNELQFEGLTALVRKGDGDVALEKPFVSLSLDEPAVAQEAFPADLERIHTIAYTSGTTGRPKGVIMTERYFQLGAKSASILADVRDDDILFLWEPFYHIAGWMTVVMALQRGVSIAMVDKFSGSKCWEQIRQSGATIFHYLGGAMNILLKQPPRPDDRDNPIRIAWGAAAPKNSWRAFEERFGVTIREGYGISEAQNFTHLNMEGRVGSIGKPTAEYESWIASDLGQELPKGEVGEIVLKPKLPGIAMKGYFRDPERTAEVLRDGCVYTSDLGYQDEDGFFYYSGRKKDSLRRRGENVSAWEVERVINAHADVEESAVVGVASDMGEQDIRAFVKLAADVALEPSEIIRWCAEHLAYYQVPRYVDFVEEFPRGPTQRIRKGDLPSSVSGSWDAEIHHKAKSGK